MIKKRNWACVIYPDSAPEDWINEFRIRGLVFAVSPLHDKDVDPTGEKKKPHYHVILCYPGPVTFKMVNDLMQEFNQPIPKALESVAGMYKYFTHKDNPDKYQYDEKDIQRFNGFDPNMVLNSEEVYAALIKIQNFVIELDLYEYSYLMDFLLQSEYMDLWNVAASHTLFLNTYITSKRHAFEKQLQKSDKDLRHRIENRVEV